MSTSFTGESSSEAFKLPGLGLPLDYVPQSTPYALFPNALNTRDMDSGSSKQLILTLREIGMLEFINSITDKDDWYTKVNNDEIAEKWKKEACEAEDFDMTPSMADYCIAELRHKASLHTAAAANSIPPPIVVLPGDVVKSDTAVSPELKSALQAAVKVFEDAIPEKLKDWHPGSNELVWDLVHPSLFPLVYGRSRVLQGGSTTSLTDCIERCGQGTVVPIQAKAEQAPGALPRWRSRRYAHLFSGDRAYSNKFQWLPCEVDISKEHARITTYINNLHPKKEDTLYGLVEKLLDASIPLWNRTLAPLVDDSYRQRMRIVFDAVEYDPDPEYGPETDGPQQGDDEDEDDYWDRRQEWIKETRQLILPEPDKPFSPYPEPAAFDLRKRYGSTGLQVIVKLANIQLTPEKPKYEGGSWHVEGQMNERIIATSIYYYSSENITPSTLAFRQQGEHEIIHEVSYPQNDNDWLWDVYGCNQEGGAVQELGSVETCEGRLITFPNILQHRVSEFELEDPTKPGHRKIVALFLVDPNMKVISSAHVPCQQQEWWWETIVPDEDIFKRSGRSIMDKIPIELQDGILGAVDFPMTMEDAKALRLELMEERKAYVEAADQAFTNHATFNLCEH